MTNKVTIFEKISQTTTRPLTITEEMESLGFTEKEYKFCHYFIDTNGNASEAARLAGYSTKSAAMIGSQKKNNPRIRKYIKKLHFNRNKALNMELGESRITAERVLEEMANIAFVNPQDIYDANGDFLGMHNISPDVARNIKSIKQKKTYEGEGKNRKCIGTKTHVELYDSLKAKEILMKHLGLLNIDINVREKKEVTRRLVIDDVKTQLTGLKLTKEQLELLASGEDEQSVTKEEKLLLGQNEDIIDIESEDIESEEE